LVLKTPKKEPGNSADIARHSTDARSLAYSGSKQSTSSATETKPLAVIVSQKSVVPNVSQDGVAVAGFLITSL